MFINVTALIMTHNWKNVCVAIIFIQRFIVQNSIENPPILFDVMFYINPFHSNK